MPINRPGQDQGTENERLEDSTEVEEISRGNRLSGWPLILYSQWSLPRVLSEVIGSPSLTSLASCFSVNQFNNGRPEKDDSP
jgi:hypothetical protein